MEVSPAKYGGLAVKKREPMDDPSNFLIQSVYNVEQPNAINLTLGMAIYHLFLVRLG